MAIIFSKKDMFSTATVDEMAKFFVSALELRPVYGEDKEISIASRAAHALRYEGSVAFFDKSQINEANIEKLHEVARVISEAHKYFRNNAESDVGCVDFTIENGEIKMSLFSPAKDYTKDFCKSKILCSIKVARELAAIEEATAKLLSSISPSYTACQGPVANASFVVANSNTPDALGNKNWSSRVCNTGDADNAIKVK